MPPQSVPPRENPLGTAPIGGLIRRFAVPTIISLLVGSLYNMTDQIFIGHTVGLLGNAATNVVFPMTFLTNALAQLAGMGMAASFNMAQGAKRTEDARKAVGTGLTLLVLFGVVLGVVVEIFHLPILKLCGSTETILPYARDYLTIIAVGLPFQLFSLGSTVLIRADGSPRYSMVANIIGAVLNVFLDWLFLYPLQWDIRGAALATVISQVVSCLLCLAYFRRFRAFSLHRKDFSLTGQWVKKICSLGTSNFANQLIMMVVVIILNNLLAYYGAQSIYGSDIPIAVSGIGTKLNALMIAFTVGIALGCQPILSFNMGAKNYPRIGQTYRRAIAAAFCICLVFFFLFQCFPTQLAGMFGSGDQLYFDFARKYLRIYLMMVILNGVQPVTMNFFTSIGDVRRGILLSLSRQGFLFVPFLLILPLFFGLDGILYAAPIADTMACILSLVMARRKLRSLDALSQEQTEK